MFKAMHDINESQNSSLSAPFIDDPNKVYGINTLGNEIFYSAQKHYRKTGQLL